MTKPQTYTGYCPRADGEAFVSAVLATRRADAAKQLAPLETTTNLQSVNKLRGAHRPGGAYLS